jgi:hypothetical protein
MMTHLLLGILVVSMGLVLGSLGVVGEYAIRIFRLMRRSPRYLIAEIVE